MIFLQHMIPVLEHVKDKNLTAIMWDDMMREWTIDFLKGMLWGLFVQESLRTVPTIVIAHTFCASPDTRISYRRCLLIQEYFCEVFYFYFYFIRFTPFIRQIHINRDNKVGKFKQLRYIVISKKNIEWRRAHYSKD